MPRGWSTALLFRIHEEQLNAISGSVFPTTEALAFMLCPSCETEHSQEQCLKAVAFDATALSVPEIETESVQMSDEAIEGGDSLNSAPVSRLIEFPGVTRRAIPEWRKELSARVREVQERRAREAAAEAEEQARLQLGLQASAPQLELLPQTEAPELNPVVAAALRRIERANQPNRPPSTYSRAATAVAVAPDKQPEIDFASEKETTSEMEALMPSESAPIPERTHNLVVVQAPVANEATDEKPKPKRLIMENDPSLSYLDSIAPAYGPANLEDQAALAKRVSAAILDMIIVAFLSLPVAAIIELQDADWLQFKTLGLMSGIVAVLMFVYATVSTALTGRTLGMRLLSLRVVDVRTGLIPTGRQSASRALFYLLTWVTGGLGFLMAFARGEGKTVHDRLTQTAIVQD